MANTAYIGLEIASSLVIAYEDLALGFKKAWSLENSRAEGLPFGSSIPQRPLDRHVNYSRAFALLLLNASIVEGTLRSIVSDKLMNDIKAGVNQARANGRTGPTKAEELLLKQHIDLEIQGGWSKLKEQHDFYFDKKLGATLSVGLNESMEVLFQLRNVLAHGTAIVQPKEKMDDSMQDIYPYKWQTTLQRTVVYLESNFDKNLNLFENLADPKLPEHFWGKTKAVFEAVEKEFTPVPSRAAKTMEMVKQLSFGYRFHT